MMLKITDKISQEIDKLTKRRQDKYARVYFTSLIESVERSDLYKERSSGIFLTKPIIRRWKAHGCSTKATELIGDMLKQGYLKEDKKSGRDKYCANPNIIYAFYRRYALTENEYNLAKDNLTYLTKSLWWLCTVQGLLDFSDDKVKFIDAVYQFTFLYDSYNPYVPPKKVTTIDNNPSLIELGYTSRKFMEVKVEVEKVSVDVLKENPKASLNSEVTSNGKNYIKYRMLLHPSYKLQNSLYTLGLSGIKVLNGQVLINSSCENIASRLYNDVYAREIIRKLYPNREDNDVMVNEWIKSNLNTMLSEEFAYLPKKRNLIISFVKKVPDHFIKDCLGEEWERELIK